MSVSQACCKSQSVSDVGFLSAYCEYVLLLVNKETNLAYNGAEYSQAGRERERETDSRQSQGDAM